MKGLFWGASLLALLVLAGCERAPVDAPSVQVQAPPKNPAGGIERVTVKAEGRGPTLTAAVDQAIQLAIEQVNGKALDASTARFDSATAVAVGKYSLDIASTSFANEINTHTRGAVTDFKVLSQKKALLGSEHTVVIEASIAKFVRPESAQSMRVAVAPLRMGKSSYQIDTRRIDAAQIQQRVRSGIAEGLSATRKITVLDREFSAEVDAELGRILEGGTAKDDFARLGQQLATDYLLVGRVDRFGYDRHSRPLRTSGKTLVYHSGGATLKFRLVNIATGQIELADTVTVDLPETEPTTLGTSVDAQAINDELTQQITERTASRIAQHFFPETKAAAVPASNTMAATVQPESSTKKAGSAADEGEPEEDPAARARQSVPTEDPNW